MGNDKELPAEPVVGDEGTDQGGFAEVARHLNREYPERRRPISRQLVHKWWIYRKSNRFPEAIGSKGRGNGGQGRPYFDLNAVAEWYERYTDTRQRSVSATPAQAQHTSRRTTGNGGSLAA